MLLILSYLRKNIYRFQINPVDVDELAEKTDAPIKDYKMRGQLSRNGQQRVRECYTASKVIPQLEQMITDLLEDTGAK